MQSRAFACAMPLTPLFANAIQGEDCVTGDEKEYHSAQCIHQVSFSDVSDVRARPPPASWEMSHLQGMGPVTLERVCTCDSATGDRCLRRRGCYSLRPRTILLFRRGLSGSLNLHQLLRPHIYAVEHFARHQQKFTRQTIDIFHCR